MTLGTGVDCVLDPVGGDFMLACLRCTKIGGCILIVGYASGQIPQIPIEQLLQRNISLVGVWATSSHYPEMIRQSTRACIAYWQKGSFRLTIDIILPMNECRSGIARISG